MTVCLRHTVHFKYSTTKKKEREREREYNCEENNVLSELSRSVCSKFVALISSSIRESGFGLVTSTLHNIGFPVPSSAFFLRSSAAFARSRDPVSLRPEPPEGFLRKRRANDNHASLFSLVFPRIWNLCFFEHWRGTTHFFCRFLSFPLSVEFPRNAANERLVA